MSGNEDFVVIDEEGNVLESNMISKAVSGEKTRERNVIRDNLGEFSHKHDEEPDIVYIDEDGNVFDNSSNSGNNSNKRTAIRDTLGEFARPRSYHLAVSRNLAILGRDLNRPRWRVEYEKVQAHCKGFEMKAKKRQGKMVVDTVEGRFKVNGKTYGLKIKIPKHYPYEIPRVYPVGWNPIGAPHRYGEGELCLMREDQWNETYSIALVIKKAQIWVHKYIDWEKTGRWPGRTQD